MFSVPWSQPKAEGLALRDRSISLLICTCTRAISTHIKLGTPLTVAGPARSLITTYHTEASAGNRIGTEDRARG